MFVLKISGRQKVLILISENMFLKNSFYSVEGFNYRTVKYIKTPG